MRRRVAPGEHLRAVGEGEQFAGAIDLVVDDVSQASALLEPAPAPG
jgi:hypothetical protein